MRPIRLSTGQRRPANETAQLKLPRTSLLRFETPTEQPIDHWLIGTEYQHRLSGGYETELLGEMSNRRNFTGLQKAQIVARARDEKKVIRCEECGGALKKGQYEIDHRLAEGLVAHADKHRKLTIADGRLLGRACCHRGVDGKGGKTADDVKLIAKAKRSEARDIGTKKPKGTIKSAPKAEKVAKEDKPKRVTHLDHLPRRSLFGRSSCK